MTPGLADLVRASDPAGVARALTLVENDDAEGLALLRALAAATGRAHRIGVTGPPGAGKSTLVSALAAAWRRQGRRVGILAVDPTSPFSGGALLGDRIRMGAHAGDAGVFIRSLASRGALGGVSPRIHEAADLLDAAGYDPVVIETVGVGQGEVEVARVADTTVVVLAPGGGDEVQAMKAGLVEVADLLVVNQCDRDGADRLAAALESALSLRADATPPPVLRTVATAGEGVEDLRARLDARAGPEHREALGRRRLDRARARVRAEVDRIRAAAFWEGREASLEAAALEVAEGRLGAIEAAGRLAEARP